MLMKNFTASVKELDDFSIMIFTDENGNDWYESQKDFSKTSLKFMFDKKGNIVSASWDVSMLSPDNLSVSEVSKSGVPKTFFDDGARWVFNGESIIPFTYSQEENIEQAELTRAELISSAMVKIGPVQLKLLAGRLLSDDESATLSAILNYIDEVSTTDISNAPLIDWPSFPE
jgi:hypothetical protein